MKRSTVANKFNQIVDAVDTWNSRNKTKRFYAMSNQRGHTLTEVGLYDYKTKKYILCDTNSPTVERELHNMEDVIRTA